MYDLKHLGANIRYLRKAHGETQEELGAAIGVEKTAVSNYEKGIREPDKGILTAIACHYLTTIEEILYHDYTGILPIHVDNKVFFRKIGVILPIISNEHSLKNRDFSKAYALHTRIFDGLKNEHYDDLGLLNNCFDYYEKAESDKYCHLFCAGNIVALTYLLLFMLTIPSVLCKKPAPLQQLAKSDPAARKLIENPDDNLNKEASQTLTNLFSDDEWQDKMIQYKYTLKKSTLWCDLADYYLALQYVWGIVDNDLSFELNSTIGHEMIDTLVSVKNKYAIDYRLMTLESAGYKSPQTVDDKP